MGKVGKVNLKEESKYDTPTKNKKVRSREEVIPSFPTLLAHWKSERIGGKGLS